MDPLDSGLHKVAAPLYQHALAERNALNESSAARKRIGTAGFEATVKVTSKSTLLFSLKDGSRKPSLRAVKSSRQAINPGPGRSGHLTHRSRRISAQRAPAARGAGLFVAHGGFDSRTTEIAYLAQAEWYTGSCWEHAGGLPRAGFTLIDAKAGKLLRKYELEAEEVWAGSQDCATRWRNSL